MSDDPNAPENTPGGFATSEELFAMLGSPDPAKDARAIEAIVRRGEMHVVDDTPVTGIVTPASKS